MSPAGATLSPETRVVRMAQFGTGHGHAAGKLLALQTCPDVELAGIFEPDPARRGARSRVGPPWADAHWLDDPDAVLGDPTIIAVASEGRNDESLEQTERLVEAASTSGTTSPRETTGHAGKGWSGGPRPGDHDPDGLHVPLSPGLPPGRRMGPLWVLGRRVRDPGAHVDLDPRAVTPPDRASHRGHLLRSRRPHAGPDRI